MRLDDSYADSYALVDDALIRLRRLWSAMAPRTKVRAGSVSPVEMSTVFVVNAIHRLREADPDAEVTVVAVAEGLGVTTSTASRLVDRAVTASMVTRRSSTVDSRRVALTLTRPGQSLLATAGAYRRSYLDQVLGGWTVAEVETFATLLDRFATAVHQSPPPSAGAAPG